MKGFFRRSSTIGSALMRPLIASVTAVALAACGGGGSAPSAPAPAITATAGDGIVTLTYTPVSGITYWLFQAADATLSDLNWDSLAGGFSDYLTGVVSPYAANNQNGRSYTYANSSIATISQSCPGALPGVFPRASCLLANGSTYYFCLSGHTGGPGAHCTAAASATPRLAGNAAAGTGWSAGTSGTTNTLRGVDSGTLFVANVDSGIQAVAVGANGTVLYSADGKTWTPGTGIPSTVTLNGVGYANIGLVTWFMAVGNGGAAYLSNDGKTWTAVSTTGPTVDLLSVTGVNSQNVFYVTGRNGTVWQINPTVSQWTNVSIGGSKDVNAIVYTNNRNTKPVVSGVAPFVAAGANGAVWYSGNGGLGTWTATTAVTANNLTGVTYGVINQTPGTVAPTYQARFVAVGAGGTVLTSDDAVNWTLRATLRNSGGVAANLTSVTFYSQYVAVDSAGEVFTSPDGITWTQQVSPTTQGLNAIGVGSYGYIGVGNAGATIYAF